MRDYGRFGSQYSRRISTTTFLSGSLACSIRNTAIFFFAELVHITQDVLRSNVGTKLVYNNDHAIKDTGDTVDMSYRLLCVDRPSCSIVSTVESCGIIFMAKRD